MNCDSESNLPMIMNGAEHKVWEWHLFWYIWDRAEVGGSGDRGLGVLQGVGSMWGHSSRPPEASLREKSEVSGRWEESWVSQIQGRDAVGMGSGCERRIESWRREKGVLANNARLGSGRVCAPFHGALSIDGCRSELEDSMFPSPLSRTVDNVLSLSCSFHRNHNHHWEIALMSNWKSVSLQRSTRWLWSALWVHLGRWWSLFRVWSPCSRPSTSLALAGKGT